MNYVKPLFVSLALCLGLMFTLTSCNDKNDVPETPAADKVAGIYIGDMLCSVMGDESTFENMTFTVQAVDETSVNITISSFGQPPMQVPEFTVSDINVLGSDNIYSLATTEFSGITETGKIYSGTLQGSFENNEITIRFNLQYGAMPMPMIFTFTAPKR